VEVRPGYKRTEVGVIPEDWEVQRIGEIADVGRGRVISHREIAASLHSLYPVYSSQTSNAGVMGYIDTYDFEGEYITWTTDGVNAGTVFYRNGRFNCTNVCGTIKLKKHDAFFVSKVLGAIAPQYVSRNLANPKLMNDVAKQIPVPLPPTLEEQRAIAEVLSDVDALIAALDRLIAKKRAIKQGAMQQLLTGQTRLPGFSGPWEVKELGEIGTLKKGRNIPKNQLSTQGKPCVLYGEIYTKYDRVVKELVSFIPEEVAEQSTTIKSGDVLFAGSGETAEEIGKCFAYIGDKEAYAGGDLIILSPTEDDSRFLGYQLNSPTVSRQKANLGQGVSVVHIYASGLATIKVPLPPLPEQRAIAAVLSDMDAEIAALEARREKTRALKQGMMQELLTGKTRLV
jgi:type I restriction enzyme S subunit